MTGNSPSEHLCRLRSLLPTTHSMLWRLPGMSRWLLWNESPNDDEVAKYHLTVTSHDDSIPAHGREDGCNAKGRGASQAPGGGLKAVRGLGASVGLAGHQEAGGSPRKAEGREMTSTRDRRAEQFAKDVLHDNELPADKTEFTADLETAFQAGWDAACALLEKAMKDSGAGVK